MGEFSPTPPVDSWTGRQYERPNLQAVEQAFSAGVAVIGECFSSGGSLDRAQLLLGYIDGGYLSDLTGDEKRELMAWLHDRYQASLVSEHVEGGENDETTVLTYRLNPGSLADSHATDEGAVAVEWWLKEVYGPQGELERAVVVASSDKGESQLISAH